MERSFRIEYWLVARPRRKLILALAAFFLLSLLYVVLMRPYEAGLSAMGIPRTLRMMLLFMPFFAVILVLGNYASGMLYQCEQLLFTEDRLVFIRRGKAIVFRLEDITRFKINEQMDKGMITNYFITAKGVTYSVYTNGTAVMHDFIHQAFVHFFELDTYQPMVETVSGIEKREYAFR
ncbi:hypothetical protein [Chitinophaga varians]|uniref:hypothetical protein n=1 Tax=Chitinophaga varians TaxID=2202339 RepID=UPI00165F4DA0|nr:hypothetical protein [Chitinophaga varians]MBC9913787.1 hypothetical protein [Chitinophaga varians]